MDRELARDEINRQEPTFLQRASKAGYICPYCGQGATKGQGLTRNSGNRLLWHCVSEGKARSVLGLYAGYAGIEDDREHFAEILEAAARYYGIALDEKKPYKRTTAAEDFSEVENQKPDKIERNAHNNIHTTAYTAAPEADYTQLFADAHSHISETDYPQKRGLSGEICDRFNLGYIEQWRMPLEAYLKGNGGLTRNGKPKTRETWEYIPTSPRLIIPTGRGSYLARDTRSDLTKEQGDYKKQKIGSVNILNASALETSAQPIYIVEGEIDALSIIEVGGEAIGLGSVTIVKRLLECIDRMKTPPAQPFIVALDNDKDGQKWGKVLEEGLAMRGLAYIKYNPSSDHKDPNEALVADRAAFTEAVARGIALAQEETERERQEELEAYQHTTVADRLQDFINGIAESVDTPCIATGFSKLDEALDGGFYPSLSIVGGLSSLGKTSLVLQIADQVAASGTDVLYFSLEMAEAELISKSISRHTLLEAQAKKLETRNAKSARGITDGKRYINYNRTERELINAAISAYGAYAGNIRIIRSGLGRIGLAEIREAVERHIRLTGRKPLIVLDYLQIIRPESDRMTDKQAADAAVSGLKNLSADTSTAIIAISSVNRASYKEAITMEALKESGGLEYGSDIVIGLQLKGAGKKDFDPTEAKKKDPRQIEAVILKNRNGRVGDTISFNYYPVFNLFAEA